MRYLTDLDLFAGWPLHQAASAGDVELIESLVASGHDPDTPDDEGGTPLFLARSEAAVRALLRLGADPGFVSERGESALMAVARIGSPDAVEALVVIGGLDPNGGDPSGNTALMEAAWAGRPDNVERLIQLHANPGATTNSGHTALDAAVREGHTDVQAVLERYVNRPGAP